MSKRPTKRQLRLIVTAVDHSVRVPIEVLHSGACLAAPNPNLFFETDAASVREAKSICMRCPARVECLEYAVDHERDGVWGGKTPAERLKLAGGAQPITPEEVAEYQIWFIALASGHSALQIARDRQCAERTVFRFKADLKAIGLLDGPSSGTAGEGAA